jgi:hypothetical protein
LARTASIRDGKATRRITEQSKSFYVITETWPGGSHTYHVQVTRKGLVISDGDTAEAYIAKHLLIKIGRRDLADLITRRQYVIS